MNIHPWLEKMMPCGIIVKVVREEIYPFGFKAIDGELEKIIVTFLPRGNKEKTVNGMILVFEQTFSHQYIHFYAGKSDFLPIGEPKYLWIEDPFIVRDWGRFT